MVETDSDATVNAMAEIFRDYIIDANGLTSEYSYKYASSKLERLDFGLSDISAFASLISGRHFSEEANYWTIGIFISAAINKIIKKDDIVTLSFANIEYSVDCIGFRLKHGKIMLHGNAGDYLGEHMSGGEITIQGNAGYYVGYCMSGGRIMIHGNAGGHIGRYMSDGIIEIEGQIVSIASPYNGKIYHKGTLQ